MTVVGSSQALVDICIQINNQYQYIIIDFHRSMSAKLKVNIASFRLGRPTLMLFNYDDNYEMWLRVIELNLYHICFGNNNEEH